MKQPKDRDDKSMVITILIHDDKILKKPQNDCLKHLECPLPLIQAS